MRQLSFFEAVATVIGGDVSFGRDPPRRSSTNSWRGGPSNFASRTS